MGWPKELSKLESLAAGHIFLTNQLKSIASLLM